MLHFGKVILLHGAEEWLWITPPATLNSVQNPKKKLTINWTEQGQFYIKKQKTIYYTKCRSMHIHHHQSIF